MKPHSVLGIVRDVSQWIGLELGPPTLGLREWSEWELKVQRAGPWGESGGLGEEGCSPLALGGGWGLSTVVAS